MGISRPSRQMWWLILTLFVLICIKIIDRFVNGLLKIIYLINAENYLCWIRPHHRIFTIVVRDILFSIIKKINLCTLLMIGLFAIGRTRTRIR
jgi:hypothetical protein